MSILIVLVLSLSGWTALVAAGSSTSSRRSLQEASSKQHALRWPGSVSGPATQSPPAYSSVPPPYSIAPPYGPGHSTAPPAYHPPYYGGTSLPPPYPHSPHYPPSYSPSSPSHYGGGANGSPVPPRPQGGPAGYPPPRPKYSWPVVPRPPPRRLSPPPDFPGWPPFMPEPIQPPPPPPPPPEPARPPHWPPAPRRAPGSMPVEGDVRLMDGSSPREGRVEIFHDSRWGTVCDDEWGDADAAVVCNQLFPGAAYVRPWLGGKFKPGIGYIWLTQVRCRGSEASLLACPRGISKDRSCLHSQDAGVTCEGSVPSSPRKFKPPPPAAPTDMPMEGQARLVDGSNQWEGRLELYRRGQWSTVCNSTWTEKASRVACRQLGYTGGMLLPQETFDPGTSDQILRGATCKGTEHYVPLCPSTGWRKAGDEEEYCSHAYDVSISCTGVAR